MAFESKLVLFPARDSIFLGYQFACHAHMKIFVRVPQPIVHHGVHDNTVADAVTGSRLWQKIRTVGHGLHSAGGNNFIVSERDSLRRQRNCFQAGAANFINRERSDTRIASAFERSLAGRILPEAGLHHVAEDCFVNLFGIDVGAARRFGNHLAAKFWRGQGCQAALKFANRRAHCR